jgi:hypothetical protein
VDDSNDIDDDDDEWLEQLIHHCNQQGKEQDDGPNTNDDDKDVHDTDEYPTLSLRSSIPRPKSSFKNPNGFIAQSVFAMVGDVNLFLSEYSPNDDNDDGDGDGDVNSKQIDNDTTKSIPLLLQGEIDIMIANPQHRNQGYGYEAVLLMMLYSAMYISQPPPSSSHDSSLSSSSTNHPPGRTNIVRFYCKIHESNRASQYLFTEKLHFVQCNYSECFQEYEYEFCCTNDSDEESNSMVHTILSKILHINVPPSSPIIPTTTTNISSMISTATTTNHTTIPSSPIRIIPCPL